MGDYYYYLYEIGKLLLSVFIFIFIGCFPACVLRFIFKKSYSLRTAKILSCVITFTLVSIVYICIELFAPSILKFPPIMGIYVSGYIAARILYINFNFTYRELQDLFFKEGL